MKRLFDRVKGATGGKDHEKHSLVGKTVMVGQYTVRVEQHVGEGGYASIYRARDVSSSQMFALKHMRLQADADAIKEVQHEAKTMARLKGHPNILRLHAVAFAGPAGAETDGFMLLDFCPVTLLEVMQRNSYTLDDLLVFEVFSEVCHAVAHMHRQSPPLAHRDVKAENILKNSDGHWVICDFGSSTTRAQVYETPAEIAAEEEHIRRTTTPAYRAPEMWDLLSRQRIDTKADVWALGVLLFVLAFGRLPFAGDSKLQIIHGKYEMPPGRSPAMRALISSLLILDPAERPDIVSVISQLEQVKQSLALPGSPPSGASAAAAAAASQAALAARTAAAVAAAAAVLGGAGNPAAAPPPTASIHPRLPVQLQQASATPAPYVPTPPAATPLHAAPAAAAAAPYAASPPPAGPYLGRQSPAGPSSAGTAYAASAAAAAASAVAAAAAAAATATLPPSPALDGAPAPAGGPAASSSSAAYGLGHPPFRHGSGKGGLLTSPPGDEPLLDVGVSSSDEVTLMNLPPPTRGHSRKPSLSSNHRKTPSAGKTAFDHMDVTSSGLDLADSSWANFGDKPAFGDVAVTPSAATAASSPPQESSMTEPGQTAQSGVAEKHHTPSVPAPLHPDAAGSNGAPSSVPHSPARGFTAASPPAAGRSRGAELLSRLRNVSDDGVGAGTSGAPVSSIGAAAAAGGGGSSSAGGSGGGSQASETEMIKVQLKGLLASHNALSGRVKQLEDIAAVQRVALQHMAVEIATLRHQQPVALAAMAAAIPSSTVTRGGGAPLSPQAGMPLLPEVGAAQAGVSVPPLGSVQQAWSFNSDGFGSEDHIAALSDQSPHGALGGT